MTYAVQMIKSQSQLEACPTFAMDNYTWGGAYQPKAYGRMAFIEGEGFVVELICEEKNPLRRFQNHGDPVYQDSCMEAFLAFNPDSDRGGYINFEMNSYGALLCAYRTGRADKSPVESYGASYPQPVATVEKDHWRVRLALSLDFIEKVYGKRDFKEGDRLKGNFYKICEEPEKAHFASFAPIESEKPNFHLPAYFADLLLTRFAAS